jgi:hypothetical protein
MTPRTTRSHTTFGRVADAAPVGARVLDPGRSSSAKAFGVARREAST